jgi:hypothetical protein
MVFVAVFQRKKAHRTLATGPHKWLQCALPLLQQSTEELTCPEIGISTTLRHWDMHLCTPDGSPAKAAASVWLDVGSPRKQGAAMPHTSGKSVPGIQWRPEGTC